MANRPHWKPILMVEGEEVIASVMGDEPDNLVLQLLRRMDAKLDRVIEDVHDLKVRVTAVVEAMAGIHRRMDRFDVRLDRIERRLELTAAPH